MPSENSLIFLEIQVFHMVYFENFWSVFEYGIIFWGNSTRASQNFLLQKKILRFMMGVLPRWSCRGLIRKLDILTFPCFYIFSLMLFK
jgi:hypothetical protein